VVAPDIWYQGPGYKWRLIAVKDRIFSVQAFIQIEGRKAHWGPLIVRFMHPAYLFQRVAFVPN